MTTEWYTNREIASVRERDGIRAARELLEAAAALRAISMGGLMLFSDPYGVHIRYGATNSPIDED
jgi:hypothetical protein